MEDIAYKLSHMQIPKHDLFELARALRRARLQLNASAHVLEVTLDGYLQVVNRDNVFHLCHLVDARLSAYGETLDDQKFLQQGA